MKWGKIKVAIITICILLISSISGCIGEAKNKSPTVSISASPLTGNAPLTVSFTASAEDEDGTITSYQWSFGDGATSTQQNPVHEFVTEGYYSVTLTVKDDDGATAVDSITIVVSSPVGNQAPTASVSASPTQGEEPLTVSFTGSGSDSDGNIISYQWSFGDGASSSSQNPTHTYTNPGTYTVTLTVTDDDGATGTDSIIIVVNPKAKQPPTVSASATPTGNCDGMVSPLEVSFNASATDPDGSIVSYHWNFGDGTTSSQQNPTHTFYAALETDEYEVTLTVTDNDGLTATDTLTITVLMDTDLDCIPDVDDIDDDNDGYLDSEDYLPKQDAKIKITLEKFRVIDEVDSPPNNLHAQVYFKIYVNDDYKARAPSSSFWDVDIDELKTINWVYTYNCPDNRDIHKINIQMYDTDEYFDDLLDIDGHDNSMGLTVNYNIQTQTWTGDDTDGITDGSYDGTQATDDDDCYLEYNIETV